MTAAKLSARLSVRHEELEGAGLGTLSPSGAVSKEKLGMIVDLPADE